MLISFDYFSLLIPFTLLVIIFGTLVVAIYKRLPTPLLWFLIAIVFALMAQFCQTVLLPQDIYFWAMPICLLFFLSVVFTTHAVYLQLKIKTHWLSILTILVIAEITLAYFCFIKPSLEARLLIVALTSLLVCLNHPQALFLHKTSTWTDRCLKYSFYSMILSILLRAGILMFCFNEQQWLESKTYIWAITQFLVLFFVILLFCIFISIAIEHKIKSLKQEGLLDPLTQLNNRRALDQILKQQLSNDMQYPYPHAILLCDIDYFKKINDQYGHYIGDLVLKELSQRLSKYLNYNDIIARIGGEEFIIILFNVAQPIAIERAKDLSRNITASPFLIENHTIMVSISVGLEFFYHLNQYDCSLKKADERLYQAKKLGRNRLIHP